VAVLFAVLGAGAFASPPVDPPTEGFVIFSKTAVLCDGTVAESERFHWTYFETEDISVPACAGAADPEENPILGRPGFREGAEIAYEQDFKAVGGKTLRLRSVPGYYTVFEKDFLATSHGVPNLAVRQAIEYNADPAGNGYAIHTEKVGLSVVSRGGDKGLNTGGGLLSLCPWATETGGERGSGYPATCEGIAAGSSFTVTNIRGFRSESGVTSTDVPVLTYAADALSGRGAISAGFVVEIWESTGQWGSRGSEPGGGLVLPDASPPSASRTSYKEYAAAQGLWAFAKKVGYQSTMPGASTFIPINPFVQVP
jgi:hypothetical protein